MPGSVFIALEGVLGGPPDAGGTFASRQPSSDALLLFHGLREHYRTIISCNEENEDLVRHWLKLQGLPQERFSMLLCRKRIDMDLDDDEIQIEHIRQVRRLGWMPSLVITATQSVAAWALSEGMTVMLFVAPTYQRAEFRPDFDRRARPWGDIEDEVTRQRELARTDTRKRT